MRNQGKMEDKMKVRIIKIICEKIPILMVATLLTFLWFNAMTPTSAVEMIKVGKKAGYKIIANVLNE